jgi:hypothetical protein
MLPRCPNLLKHADIPHVFVTLLNTKNEFLMADNIHTPVSWVTKPRGLTVDAKLHGVITHTATTDATYTLKLEQKRSP